MRSHNNALNWRGKLFSGIDKGQEEVGCVLKPDLGLDRANIEGGYYSYYHRNAVATGDC